MLANKIYGIIFSLLISNVCTQYFGANTLEPLIAHVFNVYRERDCEELGTVTIFMNTTTFIIPQFEPTLKIELKPIYFGICDCGRGESFKIVGECWYPKTVEWDVSATGRLKSFYTEAIDKCTEGSVISKIKETPEEKKLNIAETIFHAKMLCLSIWNLFYMENPFLNDRVDQAKYLAKINQCKKEYENPLTKALQLIIDMQEIFMENITPSEKVLKRKLKNHEVSFFITPSERSKLRNKLKDTSGQKDDQQDDNNYSEAQLSRRAKAKKLFLKKIAFQFRPLSNFKPYEHDRQECIRLIAKEGTKPNDCLPEGAIKEKLKLESGDYGYFHQNY
uniref:Uncharacterized protein n=1 Tax=Rhabditophanes sp. KR3021 TaxID=114890 RepID=A0AC35TZR2_9BILA